ncbi:MAG: hypothetical protein ACLS8R_09170 [Anaeromassilibacillus sp.]
MEQLFVPRWIQAFEACRVGPTFHANRRRSFDEVLPWDHLDYGIRKEFLIRECQQAYADTTAPGAARRVPPAAQLAQGRDLL